MSELEPTRTYSNPNATEVLRRMLDERGVEWEDCGNGATYVEHNGEAWRFDYDEPFDQLCIVCLSGYTPEQAIAATLGPAVRHPKPHEQWTTVLLPEIAWSWDDSWPDYLSVAHDTHGEWRTYVPEATLGSCNCPNNCTNGERTETCHMEQTGHVKVAGVDYYDDDYECSECGAEIFEGYNFCPMCGRRIEQ